MNGLIGGITGFGSLYSTYYINMSIFLACASIMPDYQLLLYGIIPIKMKWRAVCGSACGRRSAGRSDHTDRDHRIAFELYYFLFLQPESAWTQSETGCPQKEIPEADKPSAESVCRRCKAQMCSVRSYGT